MQKSIRKEETLLRRTVIKVVDEALENIFGEIVKDLFYSYVWHEYKLDKEAFHQKPEEFITALREFIGEEASKVVETFISKKLCATATITVMKLNDVNENTSTAELIRKIKNKVNPLESKDSYPRKVRENPR